MAPQDVARPIVVHVEPPRHRRELRAVVDAVVAAHEVSEEDIRGRCRQRRIVAARHLVWSLLRERGWSHSDLAREFQVDRNSIMPALRKR